jgi:uncharacterized protein (DUF305 family)
LASSSSSTSAAVSGRVVYDNRNASSSSSSVSFRLPASNSTRSSRSATAAAAEEDADSDTEGADEEGVFVDALGPHRRGALVLAARALGLGIAAAVIIVSAQTD